MLLRNPEMTSQELLGLVRILEALGVPHQLTLDKIAKLFNVRIEEHDLPLNGAGLAFPLDNGAWCVVLNCNLSSTERERTLAHELSHAILGLRDDRLAETIGAELFWEKHFNELIDMVINSVKEGDRSAALQHIPLMFRNLLSLGSGLVDKKKQVTTMGVFILGASAVAGWAFYELIKRMMNGRREQQWETNQSPADFTLVSPVATNLRATTAPLRRRRRNWRRIVRAKRTTPSIGFMRTGDTPQIA